METQHIRFIRAIATQGSISGAARELGITQPALTKILSRTEDQVGGQLFDRLPRGISLTPMGTLFLERMERVDLEMRFLQADILSLKSGLSGHVAIGVGQFWIGHIVPLVVHRLRAEAPGMQVSVMTGPRDQLLEMLLRGEIDLMLGRFAEDLPNTLSAERLTNVRLYLTVRASHPLALLGRQVTPEDLGEYSWVLPPPSDPTAIYLAELFRARFEKPVTAAVEAVSQNVVSSLLATSDLVSILPGIAKDPPTPGLVRLECDWLNWSREAGVIRVATTRLPASVERFLRLLQDEVAGTKDTRTSTRAKR